MTTEEKQEIYWAELQAAITKVKVVDALDREQRTTPIRDLDLTADGGFLKMILLELRNVHDSLLEDKPNQARNRLMFVTAHVCQLYTRLGGTDKRFWA